MTSHKLCPVPWISIETTPQGACRPCCLAKEEIPNIDLKRNTLQEAFHSDYMTELRRQFMAGEKPETCQRCWSEEAAGKLSKRMNTLIRHKDALKDVDFTVLRPAIEQLWFLDLKLGNVCNLKCRICGSWSSSKWAQEEIDRDGGDKAHLAYDHLRKGKWPVANEQFWKSLTELQGNIKYIEFTGGEPFLIKEHVSWLAELVETEDCKHIELHYNTNGTVEIPPWLRYFKSVEVAYSVDNVRERFEYERFGAKWNDLKIANRTHRENNMQTQLCFTINIQNVLYLDQLLSWAQSLPPGQRFNHIHWNYLHDPWYMNVQYMTPECKKSVLDTIRYGFMVTHPQWTQDWEQLIKFIEAGPGSDGKEFVRYMKSTDRMRNQNFADIYPEIAKEMGYE